VRDALIETTLSKDVLLMSPVQKPALLRRVLRQRGSSPKLQVFNTALIGAIATTEGFGFDRLRATPDLWGSITESAAGAELLARHLEHSSLRPLIHCWREGSNEVDCVVRHQGELFALEVKSGANQGNVKGLDAFCKLYPACRPQVLGAGGLPLQAWFGGEWHFINVFTQEFPVWWSIDA
jgi:hypothetical protein